MSEDNRLFRLLEIDPETRKVVSTSSLSTEKFWILYCMKILFLNLLRAEIRALMTRLL